MTAPPHELPQTPARRDRFLPERQRRLPDIFFSRQESVES
jgi:hypothetical protein